MIRILCLTVVLGLCQSDLLSDITTDATNIFYNLPVAFVSCKKTVVSLSNISYTLYTKENRQGVRLTTQNLNAVKGSSRVVFIIHGWLQNGNASWIGQMIETYLSQNEKIGVIVMDWSLYAFDIYGKSFCSVPLVGNLTGDFIYNLTREAGVSLDATQVNGFSLGAHVAGYAGQKVQVRTDGNKIGRINGLDAAGPGYMELPLNKRLDATDAKFVQGIHTSNWQFGYIENYAAADFQVNYAPVAKCGSLQNGCPFYPEVSSNGNLLKYILLYLFCNHVRAAVYFAESITTDNFVGVACKSCFNFGTGQCKTSARVIMGEHCLSNTRGVFYLTTNFKSPFARGNAGTAP